MWKIIVGFIIFAAFAVFLLTKSGPVDLGGEHAAQEAMHKAEAGKTNTDAAPAEAAKKP